MAPKTEKVVSARERLGLIEVDPKAEKKLKEEIVRWAGSRLCTPTDFARGGLPDNCIAEFIIESELDRILEDHYVDSIESPQLFARLTHIAGKDGYLTGSEISVDHLRESLGIYRDSIAPEEVSDTVEALARAIDRVNALRREDMLFQRTEEDPRPTLMVADKSNYEHLLSNLDFAEKLLNMIIAFLEEKGNALFEESLEYTNYVLSARNGWGYSGYFTPNNAPPSNIELEGCRRVTRIFRDVLYGLQVFRGQIKRGRFNFDDPAVMRFINSPAADLAHLPCVLGDKIEHSRDENFSMTPTFYEWVIGVVSENDATETAIELADFFVGTVGDEHEDQIERDLEGVGLYYFSEMGDAVATPDSIALASGGAAVAKGWQAARRASSGVAYAASQLERIERAAGRIGMLRRALPGATIFRAAEGASGWHRVGVAALNLGGELGKFTGYQALARASGIDGAEGVVTGAYMFLAGVVGTLEAGLPLRVSDDLLRGKQSELVDAVLAKGLSEEEMRRLAHRISGANHRTLRLSRPDETGEVLKALRRRSGELAREIRDINARISYVRSEILHLANTNREILGSDLKEEVDEIAKLADRKDALAKLEMLKTRVGQEIREARAAQREAARQRRAATPDRGVERPRRERPSPAPEPEPKRKRRANGGDNGAGGEAPERTGAVREAPEPAAIRTKGLDDAIANPPARFGERTLRKVTGGRVVMADRVKKRLARFYRETPANRRSLWQAIREKMVLGQGSGVVKDWALTVEYGETILRTKIGIHHRIFFRRLSDGTVEIVEFATRESLN